MFARFTTFFKDVKREHDEWNELIAFGKTVDWDNAVWPSISLRNERTFKERA